MAMPADANPSGDIFGGWVLSQMDIAAGICSRERARCRVVTVALDGMHFIRPVKVGDTLAVFQVSVDNEELYDDIIAIAVPIKNKQGRFYSSLAIQAPTARVTVADRDRYLPLLRQAADDLSKLADEDE